MKIEFYSEPGAEYGSADFLGESEITIADGASPEDAWSESALHAFAPLDAVEARVAFVFLQPETNDGGAVFVDSVTLFERLAGDYNHDDVVDAADYTVWRNSKGAEGDLLDADGNLDGVVDELDYDAVGGQPGRDALARGRDGRPRATHDGVAIRRVHRVE